MDTPDKIPLQEAAARELLPCSVCGATGAGVRRVEGKKHLLCAACEARGRRWAIGAAAAAIVVLAVVLVLRFRGQAVDPSIAPPPPNAAEAEKIQKEIIDLMQHRQYLEALPKLAGLIKVTPSDPTLNLYLGRCLLGLGYFEAATRPFQLALGGDPKDEPECRVSLGTILQNLGHSSQALPFLEKEFPGSPVEPSRHALLSECYVDLERYDDALALLKDRPLGGLVLRDRHRLLRYGGKAAEGRALIDGATVPPQSRAMFLALEAREDGDFAAALKLLEEAAAKVDPKSPDLLRLKVGILQVLVESGDTARIEEEAAALAKVPHPVTSGEARYYLVLGRLMAGKKDAAVAAAHEFLKTMDIQLGLLRSETLALQHLAGTRKIEELVGEAAAVNRFRANDLYFFLALETGDPQWAKKAAESSVGHNFPYHAIQRLLKK